MPTKPLYPVRGILTTTPQFRRELRAVSERLTVDPTDLASIMAFESGFNPKARNMISGATGLIQWMPDTARGMYGLTVAQIAGLSAIEQLPLVERYFQGIRGRGLNAHDLYMLVWNGSPASPDKVLGVSDAGGHSGAVYAQNKGLDLNHDGKITAAEASAIVRGIAAAARKLPPLEDDEGPKAPAPATAPVSPSVPLSSSGTYRVRPGDSPFSLAQRGARDGNRWRELFQCNPRSAIERLLAFSVIQIPKGWVL